LIFAVLDTTSPHLSLEIHPIKCLKPASMQNYPSAPLPHFANAAKRSSLKKPAIYLSLAVAVVIAGVFINNKIQEQRLIEQQQLFAKMEQDNKTRVRNNIRSYVKVTAGTYQYSKLGGVFGLSMLVINNSNYPLENVHVKVQHITANGGLWKEQFVDFKLLQPGTQMSIPIPDEQKGVSVRYEIVSIKSSSLGL
jgi:hypothetical protein